LENSIPRYWKNGNPFPLDHDPNSSYDVNSIAVSGDDVYVAGTEGGNLAKYWKNGSAVNLTTPINGSSHAEARCVVVLGNDVYVAGNEFDGSHQVAKYWKNGAQVNLTDDPHDGSANSIFLLER
jgi:hypothetical protein